jgi:hypothetical protein
MILIKIYCKTYVMPSEVLLFQIKLGKKLNEPKIFSQLLAGYVHV